MQQSTLTLQNFREKVISCFSGIFLRSPPPTTFVQTNFSHVYSPSPPPLITISCKYMESTHPDANSVRDNCEQLCYFDGTKFAIFLSTGPFNYYMIASITWQLKPEDETWVPTVNNQGMNIPLKSMVWTARFVLRAWANAFDPSGPMEFSVTQRVDALDGCQGTLDGGPSCRNTTARIGDSDGLGTQGFKKTSPGSRRTSLCRRKQRDKDLIGVECGRGCAKLCLHSPWAKYGGKYSRIKIDFKFDRGKRPALGTVAH